MQESAAAPPSVTAELFDQWSPLRTEIIRDAARISLARLPQLTQRLGAHAREAISEELGWHLDFLLAAIEARETEAFTDYLAWHAQVTACRGLPADALLVTLTALGEALESHALDTLASMRKAIDAGYAHLSAGAAAPTYDRLCPEPWIESAAFCETLIAGDRHEAARLFEQALARENSLSHAEVHVVQPAMYDVGRRWQANQISVAQEHLATAIAQTLMAQGLGRMSMPPSAGRSALLACPAGNHHTLGLHMVADALGSAGWMVHYLGADTPVTSLVAQAQQLRPDLIALSASLPHQLRTLRQAVASLRATLGPGCPAIGIGGLVFNQFPGLARGIGVPLLGANALDVVTAARTLVSTATP